MHAPSLLIFALISSSWSDPPSCDQWIDRDVEECIMWCKPLELQHECIDGRCLCCNESGCWEVIPHDPGC